MFPDPHENHTIGTVNNRSGSEVRAIQSNYGIYDHMAHMKNSTGGKRALSTLTKHGGTYSVEPSEKISLPEIAMYNKEHNQKISKIVHLRKSL